ncbi:D-2-hydroxyacid dehydrogenase [Chloroflexota bacterium]
MDQINILNMSSNLNLSLDRIASISPRLHVIDAKDKFNQEIRETWAPETVNRLLPPADESEASQSESEREKGRKERDSLMAQADIVCIGYPYPLDIATRGSRLKWVHQTVAGASNLRFGDLHHNNSIVITTSRGYSGKLPIAEYVIAAALTVTKELPRAVMDKPKRSVRRQDYHLRLLQGKTMGIVGLGGIGGEVARLARALGMRVLATRRSASARTDSVDGVDTLFPTQEMDVMLADSDFVAVCAQHTPETEGMIGEAQFRAMKPTAYFINIARGELVDEDAMIRALREGWIAGAILDVHADSATKSPPDDFWDLPNLILTPHVSGGSDVPRYEGIEFFYENLTRFVSGRELLNVIDWERGY